MKQTNVELGFKALKSTLTDACPFPVHGVDTHRQSVHPVRLEEERPSESVEH